MMKIIKLVISIPLVVLIFSCTKNHWISDNAVRPKKPKFSILKQPFIGNNLIDTFYLYLSTSKFPNFDGRKSILYFGFYKDGRMIVDNTWENEKFSTLTSRNSWETGAAVGYYTTGDNKIKIQYFVSFDAGTYISAKGVIKKDTIILEKIRHWKLYDTLIKTTFLLVSK